MRPLRRELVGECMSVPEAVMTGVVILALAGIFISLVRKFDTQIAGALTAWTESVKSNLEREHLTQWVEGFQAGQDFERSKMEDSK